MNDRFLSLVDMFCSILAAGRRMSALNCAKGGWPKIRRLLLRVLAGCWFASMGSASLAAGQNVWGYVAWWMPLELSIKSLAGYERVIFFQIDVSADGTLEQRHGWPDQWLGLTKAAADHRVALDLGITLMDPAVFNAVFGSSAASDRLLAEALALASQPGVSGLHLDVEVNVKEGVKPEAIRRFRGFVAALSTKLGLQSPARELSVFLPFGDLGAIYDASTLAHAQFTVLQGYDAHFLESRQAGPISPLKGDDFLTWAKILVLADGLGLARRKLVMSFPLYGYEWLVPSCLPRGPSEGKGEATTLLPMDPLQLPLLRISISDRVRQYGARVEPESGSLYYHYVTPSGTCAVGWFEDSYSLRFKAEWLEQQNLHGLAFFPLGYDQGILSTILKQRWKR